MAKHKRKIAPPPPEKKRPLFIAFVAWILIIFGFLAFTALVFAANSRTALVMMAQSPVPMPVQWTLSYAGVIVSIVSGIGMLRGDNWSRWLYLGFSSFSFILNIITMPSKLALFVGLLIFMIIAVLLLCEEANDWFAPKR